ncbi:hypothetical protein [Brevundimonas aurifodinae]|uniref:Uncharacterized protein n=2 Tax=Brevundimonas TaxID=41275 RepID=A0ABV1NN60_9CAUL|nr:MAG: hypothetical protein B7Z42_11845 [Brevundimonas sp. 12-68-7]OYX30533.1 MAG: hypothetical protein B7Z01_14165 [Brevundimonas subvibrioides]
MTSIKTFTALAAGTLVIATAGATQAQTPYSQSQPQPYGQSQTSGQEVFGQILQNLFGGQTTGTVDAEWSRGRRALGGQQATFNARLDAQVRSGALQSWSADRIRTDYDALVRLEADYARDGRFTTQERQDLTARYDALTRALDDGGYGDDIGGYQSVADGRAEFERRIDAAVSARRLSRTDATRLRADYAALIRVEADYQRGGLTLSERQDIETRLDALDARVGDVGYGNNNGGWQQSPRDRLAAIERAIASLNRDARADRVRVQLEDLTRLEAAYSRASASADDRAYLDRRIGELEIEARVRR